MSKPILRSGTRFIMALPNTTDDRLWRLGAVGECVVAIHPEHLPVVIPPEQLRPVIIGTPK